MLQNAGYSVFRPYRSKFSGAFPGNVKAGSFSKSAHLSPLAKKLYTISLCIHLGCKFERHIIQRILGPSQIASSSEEKEEGNKMISPSKETENEVDVESIEDNAAAVENTQSMFIAH